MPKKTKMFKFVGEYKEIYALSVKEKLICDEFLKLGSTPKSVIMVINKNGYRLKNLGKLIEFLSRFLSKPNVSQFIYLNFRKFGALRDDPWKQTLFFLNQDINPRKKLFALGKCYKLRGRL